MTPLGWGLDGVVFLSPQAMTAIKVHSRPEAFERELAVYHRLDAHRVTTYQGFAVPRLVQFDRTLKVIEMSVVKSPCVLDFAAAELDFEREFEEGILEDWWETIRQDFGDDFEAARSLFYGLASELGIYYWDLKPRNLQFR